MRDGDAGTRVEFGLLGSVEAVRDGASVPLGGPRQRGLLALLLLRANEVVSREQLIDGLWGEHAPETAVNALQVAVHSLRRLLGPERIVTRGRGYVLRVEPGELDLEQFERLVSRARGELPAAAAELLREALALWRGAALADLPEVPFAAAARARLEELRLAACEERIDRDLALGLSGELVPELEALVDDHPYRERPRLMLMLALYRAGRQADALRAYQQARRTLVEDLGIEPGVALQELERAILRQDAALAAPTSRPPANLPAPLTPLVGRQLELAAVTAQLRSADVRLLTLTGPGGTGKTRLAIEIGAELLEHFPDGVFFVDLSPLRDATFVAQQILGAMDIAEQPGRSIVATLKETLREKQLLLLLDNFEHVAEAGPFVTSLLAAAPRAKALATSRAALRLSGEHEYPVPPLALPDLEHDRVDTLTRSEAVELFGARAKAAVPHFRVTADNARAVAAVCVALDGLPLAIELAAAQSRVLSPEAMLERLSERLELLTEGPRDAPARQQTLRATLDWSFALLDDDERRIFGRLAVFAGGCTLDAAEAVCEADPAVMSALVDKSLLRRDESPDGESRFRMLETVREYAIECLEEAGEATHQRQRHAEYYRAVVERAAQDLRTGEPTGPVYARLESDLANLRAALSWAEASGAFELMLQIAGLLKLFWRVRGHLEEGRGWLERALVHAGTQATTGRARALEAVGALAQRSGDYAAARAVWEEALEVWRELGEEAGVARCLGDLGTVFDLEGDFAHAIPAYEESAELLRAHGLDYELATVVSNLGECLTGQGRLDEAAKLYQEGVELSRASGREEQLVISLFNLGRVAALQGDHDRAAELFDESLARARDLGYREMIAYGLKGIGEVFAARGDAERAARLLGVSDQLFASLGAHVEAIERQTYERTVEQLKGVLGEDSFASAYAQGREMPLEQAFASTLAGVSGSAR